MRKESKRDEGLRIHAAYLLHGHARLVRGQTETDSKSVRKIPQDFCDSWAKHDGHALAKIMADDVDFVTVGATLIHGRSDFETYHTQLLSGRFKDSTITLQRVETRFLRSDVAIVHWTWKVAGDKNPDGSPRNPRYGMMTMIAEKRGGAWLVAASQNDNSTPGSAPEFNGLTSPIPLPDQVGVQPSNQK
jgi:uncharacterized protein (TIGR02246 family)